MKDITKNKYVKYFTEKIVGYVSFTGNKTDRRESEITGMVEISERPRTRDDYATMIKEIEDCFFIRNLVILNVLFYDEPEVIKE